MRPLEIVLLRHGQTAENVRGVYLGDTNAPLSAEGAAALRRTPPPQADIVFVSPLLRCMQTASILYPQAEPVVLPALRERSFGRFEGLTHAEITARPGFARWGMSAKGMRFPQGEEYAAFLKRTRRAFWQVVRHARRAGARKITIVTHGGVICAILSQLVRPHRSFYSWRCANGGGYRCVLQNGTLAVREEM